MGRFIAWLLVSALAAASPASATWLEASTGHFLIYSDTNPKELQDYATRLERYDAGLRKLFRPPTEEDEGRRSNRVRIYVLDNPEAVRALCVQRCPNILGFYTARAGGSMIFTPRRSGNGAANDLGAQTVLFHEYAHHFMHANFAAAYPAWYMEGFAEFNSTARFERDGSIGYGLPANHRAYGLMQGQAVTAEAIVSGGFRPTGGQSTEALYGRGWLLTHYFLFAPGRQGQLGRYLRAINAGTPAREAAIAAFGDLKALSSDVEIYLRKARMSYNRVPVEQLEVGRIAIRPLSDGEAAMMPVHIRSSRGVDPESAARLVPQARQIAAAYPADAAVQTQLAEAEIDAGHDAEADAAADRAIAADPKAAEAMLYKGRIVMRRAATAGRVTPDAAKAARVWFVRANRADNNAVTPLVEFYDSYVRSGVRPTEAAINGLYRAFELAPEDSGVRIRVAHQSLVDNKGKDARAVLQPIAYDPHHTPLQDRIQAVLTLIDQGKLTEADAFLGSRT